MFDGDPRRDEALFGVPGESVFVPGMPSQSDQRARRTGRTGRTVRQWFRLSLLRTAFAFFENGESLMNVLNSSTAAKNPAIRKKIIASQG